MIVQWHVRSTFKRRGMWVVTQMSSDDCRKRLFLHRMASQAFDLLVYWDRFQTWKSFSSTTAYILGLFMKNGDSRKENDTKVFSSVRGFWKGVLLLFMLLLMLYDDSWFFVFSESLVVLNIWPVKRVDKPQFWWCTGDIVDILSDIPPYCLLCPIRRSTHVACM